MKKSIILLIFLWASVSFGAPALCSGNGATYDSLAFCESQCAESCTELVSSGGTCSSSYKNYVYDNSTNTTYALTQTTGTWNAFQSSAIVRNADINTLLKNILSYSGASSAWIGLYDPDKTQNLGSTDDTRFEWRDGTLLNYRNWASGQPDNAVSGGDIGNVAVYGEHWVLMNSDGTWSDTGEHAGQSMIYPSLVEFSGQLGCVTGTMPTEKVEPDDMISSYCTDNPDKCYLCTDSTEIYQCTEGTYGGYLCPQAQATCDAQWANSSCGSGGVLNTTSDKCELARNILCPANMSFESSLERCVMTATCPNGGILNGVTDLCEVILGNGSCPSGYSYDAVNNGCVRVPDCSAGTYNTSTDRCEFAVTYSCSSGYTYNSTTSVCEAAPVCPAGTSYNSTQDKCMVSATLSCPSGYTLSGSTCISAPTCAEHSNYNSSTNLCESEIVNTCPSGMIYADSTYSGGICLSSPTYYCDQDFTDAYGSHYELYGDVCGLVNCYPGSWYDHWGNFYSVVVCDEPYDYFPASQACPAGSLNQSTGECESYPEIRCLSPAGCSSSPVCSGGGTYNNSTNRCEISTTKNCVSGTSYDSALNMCVTTPTCSSGGLLNTTTDKCSLTVATSCPSGYTMSGNVCYSSPICSSGIYNAALNTCILSAATLCPAGYSFNPSTDKCELAPSCSEGSYSTTIDQCVQLPTISCATGYTYNSSLKLCESNPRCSSGSYNTAQNQCLTGYACPYSGQPCVETNGQWKCSKYPCYNATDESNYTSDDTTEGANDIIADGETDDEGNCLGTIYIFSGNDNRCRKSGVQTGFSDCCKKKKDWLGLAKCSPKEQLISSLRSWGKLDGQCHEVGEYCSEKWVGVCVQKKRTYCCFGSPLARIIIEQGRPQLDIGWGNAKEPNCRGFTPDEFQKLDFSKISFQEWIDEYVVPELNENISNNIKETFENITLPTGVSQ